MTNLTSPEEIAVYRLHILRRGLLFEMSERKRLGPSFYSIIKREFGFRGSRRKVLRQLEDALQSFAD
jgi:hypothetical protein